MDVVCIEPIKSHEINFQFHGWGAMDAGGKR